MHLIFCAKFYMDDKLYNNLADFITGMKFTDT